MKLLRGGSQVGAVTILKLFDCLGAKGVKFAGRNIRFKLGIPPFGIQSGNPLAQFRELLRRKLLYRPFDLANGAHDDQLYDAVLAEHCRKSANYAAFGFE
ncbi:MAG TPA: hypothetical protein VGQ99_06235 [Tepidisphaeraceae bacterium]|jgi:hypothetical protein|nr:hypothetical protein [Tepidisphaeraceae bacterium]